MRCHRIPAEDSEPAAHRVRDMCNGSSVPCHRGIAGSRALISRSADVITSVTVPEIVSWCHAAEFGPVLARWALKDERAQGGLVGRSPRHARSKWLVRRRQPFIRATADMMAGI